ncbi:transposable element Tcb2 transposase [Trichonephila clavipes]|nr:transposable element Tcb2 transposase [Trichonephila clavipes]
MNLQNRIDISSRGRIIGKIEEGRKITDVTREFDIALSVVSRLWKSFKTTGMCNRRHGGGRVRSTTPEEDRYIVLSAKRNRRTTAQQVANQFLAASGKQISRKTVARRLRGGELYARRPVVCVPLTRQHRTARWQWCRQHHNWTEQDWACVLFSDESRFSLSSDCRRQLIWRESGTAYRPENIQEKDRYPTCSIMVWAGIVINGRTRLHVVANGTMTDQRYIDEVLLPHVRLFRGAVGDKFVFMDDNATCHRILAVQDCLDSEGIQRFVWPARSPDRNPIENVWDALGRQVAGRNYPPTNKNTLIRALTEKWDKLPQQLLDNVVKSMVHVPSLLLLPCVYYWDTYERHEIDEQKHITQPQKNTDFVTNDDPNIEQDEGCAAVPFETGIHFRRKTDFFPEEDTTKFYAGFEPEPTRLQAEGHSHHTVRVCVWLGDSHPL